MKKVKQVANPVLLALIAVWVLVSIYRSFVHLHRIYQENTEGVPTYLEDVEKCGYEPADGLKLMYYNYLNVGEECEE